MKKNKGYSINHVEAAIIITKDFGKRASIDGTIEYDTLRRLRDENPAYAVKYRTVMANADKRTHKGLSFAQMETYIKKLVTGKELIDEFKKVKEHYKDTPACYANVKKWFFANKILEKFNNMENTTPSGESA
ncbi:MAG: hypothetical protein FWC82_03735 [Firmicutes bacterium]|nr:hypothetical protein [Bacillota bacterium]